MSRNKFFNRERMPRDLSFWSYYLQRHAQTHDFSEEQLALLADWMPHRSNCPELTDVVEGLLEAMPLSWRTLADDIFVGRVLSGDVNAMAETSKDARIVKLYLQYTIVLHAYATARDEQLAAIRQVIHESSRSRPVEWCNSSRGSLRVRATMP